MNHGVVQVNPAWPLPIGQPGRFNPLSLFAGGYAGFYFPGGDPTALVGSAALYKQYQDLANTPATADAQPVGLGIDISQGPTLGSEMITDPTATNPTYWVNPSTGVAVTGAGVTWTAASSGARIDPATSAITTGGLYQATLTIGSISAGAIRLANAAGNTLSSDYNAPGTFTFFFIGIAGETLRVRCVGTTTALLTNFSAKRVSGNHALQATASATPTLKNDATLNKWYWAADGGDVLTGAFKLGATGTIIAVIRATAATSGTIIGARDASDGYCSVGLDSSGFLVVNLGSSAAAYQGATDLRGADHSIAVTYSGGNALVSVDGGTPEAFTYSGTPTTTNALYIGARNNNGSVDTNFTGRLWQPMQVVNNVLSAGVLQQAARAAQAGIVA